MSFSLSHQHWQAGGAAAAGLGVVLTGTSGWYRCLRWSVSQSPLTAVLLKAPGKGERVYEGAE